MRSGRLWSEAGRQVKSTAGKPARRVSSTSSRASAPQPMTSGGRTGTGAVAPVAPRFRIAERPSGDTRPPLPDQRHGGLDGDRRVAAIRIGADRLAELLVQRRAADQDDVVLADSALHEL